MQIRKVPKFENTIKQWERKNIAKSKKEWRWYGKRHSINVENRSR